MATPVISIITVCYNAEREIEATLKSVNEQSFKEYEYIIIDGASKDNTLKVISQSGVEPTHLVSERDKGIYDAMNKALALAKGDYLMFLNAGDSLYSSDTLQRIADVAKNEVPDVIYGDTAIVDADRNYLRPRKLRPPKNLTSSSFKNGMLVCHQSFYVRTDIARKHLYNLRYRFSADFDWCVRIMKEAQNDGLVLHNTHTTLTDYLSEGMTTKNMRKSLLERLRIMCRHYGCIAAVWQHLWFVLRTFTKP